MASAMGARVVAILVEGERGDLVRRLGAREIIFSRNARGKTKTCRMLPKV